MKMRSGLFEEAVRYGRIQSGQSLGAAGRGEMFRTGAQPSLAAGRALSRLRQRGGDPQRPRRDATASATLSLQSLQRAFRRSDGHGAGWPPPATARVGAVSLPDGVEPLQSEIGRAHV